MSWTAELDPHYDRLWSEFERGLAAREVLDTRTRLLVLLGECVVLGETAEVVGFAEQALDAGVRAADIHEVMLQACTSPGDRSSNTPSMPSPTCWPGAGSPRRLSESSSRSLVPPQRVRVRPSKPAGASATRTGPPSTR